MFILDFREPDEHTPSKIDSSADIFHEAFRVFHRKYARDILYKVINIESFTGLFSTYFKHCVFLA